MAILNLSQYYTDQADQSNPMDAQMIDSSKNKFFRGVNPVTGEPEILQPIDTKMKEPILQGFNSDSFRQDLINDFNKVRTDNNINLDMKDSTKKVGPGMSTGNAITSSAGSVLNFASDVYQSTQSTAQSDRESDNKTMKLAASGMAMGATIGSVIPGVGTVIGAAAGAVIGGVAGMVQKVPARKKRLKQNYEQYEGRLFDQINQRKIIAEDYQKQQELEYQQNLMKAQMGLLNLKY